jgi:hypothetical protein
MFENIDIHVETDDIPWLGDNFKCLDSDEEMFWTELISNYLEPLHHNEETKRLVNLYMILYCLYCSLDLGYLS